MKRPPDGTRYRNVVGVFALSALLMLVYEGVKEWIFQGRLSPWESHGITIVVTSLIAVLISLLVGRRMQALSDAARAVDINRSQFLETLLASLPMAVFYKDREGRYLGCNGTFTEVMGVSSEAIRGKTVDELWPGELAETYHRKDLELMANPHNQQYEFKIKDKLGRVQDVIYSKGVFFDDKGEVAGIIGSFFDISEKKETERKLAAYRDQLEAMVAQKTAELQRRNEDLILAKDAAESANRAKSAFLANMGHELRTPLNAILGFAQLLREDVKGEDQKEFLQTIVNSGGQLLRLINGVLEMSKLEIQPATANVPLSVVDILEEAIAPWRFNAVAKGLELKLEVDRGLPETLTGDPDKLARVLWHLMDNAIKFSQAGTVTLRARQLPSVARQPWTRFEVEDQGIGIAEEDQPTVFEPFSQVDDSSTRPFGGAGLGLAQCRQLVRSMGGEIGVRSAFGKGSVFWFDLPLAQPEGQPESVL